MPSQSMIRSLRIFLITATLLGCSHSSYSQQSIPPIDMTLTEFNQGRPANFYYLADATEGYEAVCEEVLEALNEPYPGEPYAEYNEPYSKYLLRSRLSVPWVEMPDFPVRGNLNRWNTRYVSTDINNDLEAEDLFVSINNLHSMQVHNFAVIEKGIFPAEFNQVSKEMSETLIAQGAFAKGREITGKFDEVLALHYDEYNYQEGGTPWTYEPYLDVLELKSVRYILFTASSPIQDKLEAFLLKLEGDTTLFAACRLASRYSIGIEP